MEKGSDDRTKELAESPTCIFTALDQPPTDVVLPVGFMSSQTLKRFPPLEDTRAQKRRRLLAGHRHLAARIVLFVALILVVVAAALVPPEASAHPVQAVAKSTPSSIPRSRHALLPARSVMHAYAWTRMFSADGKKEAKASPKSEKTEREHAA